MKHNKTIFGFLKAQHEANNILCAYQWKETSIFGDAGLGRQQIVSTHTAQGTYDKMKLACKKTHKRRDSNGGHMVHNLTLGIALVLKNKPEQLPAGIDFIPTELTTSTPETTQSAPKKKTRELAAVA